MISSALGLPVTVRQVRVDLRRRIIVLEGVAAGPHRFAHLSADRITACAEVKARAPRLSLERITIERPVVTVDVSAWHASTPRAGPAAGPARPRRRRRRNGLIAWRELIVRDGSIRLRNLAGGSGSIDGVAAVIAPGPRTGTFVLDARVDGAVLTALSGPDSLLRRSAARPGEPATTA